MVHITKSAETFGENGVQGSVGWDAKKLLKSESKGFGDSSPSL